MKKKRLMSAKFELGKMSPETFIKIKLRLLEAIDVAKRRHVPVTTMARKLISEYPNITLTFDRKSDRNLPKYFVELNEKKETSMKTNKKVSKKETVPTTTKKDEVSLKIFTDDNLKGREEEINNLIKKYVNDETLHTREEIIAQLEKELGIKYLDIEVIKNQDDSLVINASRKFLVTTIRCVRFNLDEPERVVYDHEVLSDTDLSNDIPAGNDLVVKAKAELVREGWSFSDDEAIQRAYRRIEHLIDTSRHNAEYVDLAPNYDGNIVKETVIRLVYIHDAIKYVNQWNAIRNSFKKRCCNLPAVLPPEDELREYNVINGKFTKVGKPVTIQKIEIPEEKRAQIQELFKSIIKEDKDN